MSVAASVERKKPEVLCSTKDLSYDDWKVKRREIIGGSDIAALFGLDKYKSEVQLFLEKTGQWKGEDEDSEAAWIGREMEETVARLFCEKFERETGKPIKVRRRNFMFQHPDYSYMGANIDRDIVGENAGLECKTASEYLKDEWVGDDIPDKYMLQIQWYMYIMDYDRMYIAVIIGGNKLRWKVIERMEPMMAAIAQRVKDFWHLVQNNILPIVDGGEASGKALKIMYPPTEAVEEGVQLEQEAVEAVQLRDEAKANEDYWKTEKTKWENRLKQMLGEKTEGFLNNGGIVSWKPSKEFDQEALKEKHPDVYQECCVKLDLDLVKKKLGGKGYDALTTPTGSRKLNIKLPKEA